jgi:hypothetical protein
MQLRWVFTCVTNGTSPNNWLKLKKTTLHSLNPSSCVSWMPIDGWKCVAWVRNSSLQLEGTITHVTIPMITLKSLQFDSLRKQTYGSLSHSATLLMQANRYVILLTEQRTPLPMFTLKSLRKRCNVSFTGHYTSAIRMNLILGLI